MNTPKPLQFLTRPLLAMLLVLFIASGATAQPDSSDPHISATLHTASMPIPGHSLILAITLYIEDGWHTYWPGINDTGYGISMTFDSIDSLTFGDPVFPTPQRSIEPGNILDHIYEGRMTIYVPVNVEDSVSPGEQIIINATIDYLVCKEYCVPESVIVTGPLYIPNNDGNIPGFSGFYVTDRDFPQQINDSNYTPFESNVISVVDGKEVSSIACGRNFVERHWNTNEVVLDLLGATHYIFFPDTNCTQPADLIAQGDTKSKTLTITFDRRYEDDPTTPARLSGRLRVNINDTWQDFDVDYTQPTPTEPSP